MSVIFSDLFILVFFFFFLIGGGGEMATPCPTIGPSLTTTNAREVQNVIV